ncbi:uncharacterized protein LOC120069128 [Benincasa hispida]|uniref:uncharacterized protein LOC120069128 n=1 Tax=Benincasa hispida TaxID=102211 RepID=UPI0018FF6FB0|nr:uncharacterized protein LOC120069128 [Benincasa hispida]
MSNSTIQLLAFDKFNGEGYSTWKSNINTIFVVNDLSFVLTEECPPVPSSTITRNVRDVYNRWVRENEKAQAYILASISDVLNKKHKVMPTAREIMTSLQKMFGQPSSSVTHEAIKYIYVTCMKHGTNVREHVLDVMVHFNVAEAHGATDEMSQIEPSETLTTFSKNAHNEDQPPENTHDDRDPCNAGDEDDQNNVGDSHIQGEERVS